MPAPHVEHQSNPLHCVEVKAKLRELQLGMLDAQVRDAIERHLAICDDCRAALQRIRGEAITYSLRNSRGRSKQVTVLGAIVLVWGDP
jgi:hypothetical protein